MEITCLNISPHSPAGPFETSWPLCLIHWMMTQSSQLTLLTTRSFPSVHWLVKILQFLLAPFILACSLSHRAQRSILPSNPTYSTTVWRVNWVWESNNWVTCTVSGSSGWVSLASAWKAFLAMLLRRLISTEVWLLPLGTIGCGSKFPWS